jgi:radical SAM superfamily enzyme YgiQ (UPF0313 family)
VKILLVYPNADERVSGYNDLAAIAEPIALEYVGAVATKAGHDVQLLDLRLHKNELIPTLRQLQPDLVGVTAYTQHVLRALEICRVAKKIVPTCTTVCGGHHATLEPRDFLEPEVDLVVQGEGTVPFASILDKLSEGASCRGVAGVWAKNEDADSTTSGPSQFTLGSEPQPFDIDRIIAPDRTLTARDRHHYFIAGIDKIALVRTTVGCPYRCSFCALWVAMDGRYYIHKVDRTVSELASLQEQNVMLVDDEPFVNRKHMTALAEAIVAAGIKKRYYAYCRSDSFLRESELLELWKSIGLHRLFIGVESIFDEELALYNKRQKRQQVLDTFSKAKDLGISLHANFIINTNYTAKQFDEVRQFIVDADLEYPTFTVLTPIPGTVQDFDNVIINQRNGRPDWRFFDLQNPVTKTHLPTEEFRTRYTGLYHAFRDIYAKHGNPYVHTMRSRSMARRGLQRF